MNGDKWKLTDEYKRVNGYGKSKEFLDRDFTEEKRNGDLIDLIGLGLVNIHWLTPSQSSNKNRAEWDNRLHRLDIPIYSYAVWVAIDCPNDFLEEKFKENIPPLDDHLAAYTCNISGGVLIRFRNISCMGIKYMAHESVHAALELCNYIGLKVDYNNQEPLAFLIDFIVDFCNKTKNKTLNTDKNGRTNY